MFTALATYILLPYTLKPSPIPPDPLPAPLLNAHSHNDYYRPRPLHDALAHGFTSVEADIFLRDGKLLVAHTAPEINPAKDLETLYLQPLAHYTKRTLAATGEPRLAPGWPEIILLVDIKADGPAVLPVLKNLLAKHPETFSTDDQIKAVRVVISGDRPVQAILQDPVGLLALDGRPTDLGQSIPVRRMPIVSQSYIATVRDLSPNPAPEALANLRDIVARAHAESRRVRFWALPDTPAHWALARRENIDLVNTGRPADLARFLTNP